MAIGGGQYSGLAAVLIGAIQKDLQPWYNIPNQRRLGWKVNIQELEEVHWQRSYLSALICK